ncbi:MAG TPA: S8 family peptidase, partial [Lacipirellulaceae bacterium]|nr:S8 family peptidase [Lacipirellulaceae bacterium]
MFKGSLLAGVALAVLTVAVPAAAKTATTTTKTSTTSTSTSTNSTSSTTSSISVSSAPLEQFSGSVGPFYGHIDPFYGSINPFYGSINPFYGRINPFYGQISPFWGSTTQFWGTINPFYGSINPFYGKIDPFWGTINPFYGSINPFYGTISPFWQSAGPQWGALNLEWANLQASSTSNYSSLQTQLNSFIASAQSFWGAAVQKATGKDFMSGFASAMLAKYGIDPNNPASLANVDAATRSAFFLNWYDGLMNYAGVDHVDWWMGAVHWTPQLSQIQNAGSQSIIGVLDTWFDAGKTYGPNMHFAGGYKYFVNDHGAEVASLIAAKQDGQGVMGVAPNSDVELYNPFDTTGTASWTDVLNGILTLHNKGAAVINASLGVPGWTLSSDWASIFANPSFVKGKAATIIVKAAGNEGVAQTANVTWQSAQVPSDLLIVGSVDPDGNISSFSNTPGNACIMVSGVCDKLMNHFLVAPGENILVEDSSGNLSRASGTSFAAPLVTGAVALLQDRWPWLQQHSAETVQIILQSATDLGAPGVDPVYGWGELNIQASQSPLNFDNLIVYQPYSSTSGPGAAGAGPA